MNNLNESYACDGNKLCVVFNQKIYNGENYKNRDGTDLDCHRLKTFFEEKLSYEFKELENFTRQGFEDYADEVKEICIEKNMTCLVVVFLSHGNEKNCLIDVDEEEIQIYQDIVTTFTEVDPQTKRPFMEGKPKLIIMQCCRGKNYLPGIVIEGASCCKSEVKIQVSDNDILIAYATLPGKKGSLKLHSESQHLLIMVCTSPGGEYDYMHYCYILRHCLEKFNFTIFFYYNINSSALINECKSILNTETFSSKWIMFIGPAIEYGPVSKDSRCFNLRNILSQLKSFSKKTMLIMFVFPHHDPGRIQHDAADPSGPFYVTDLKHPEYFDFLEEIVNLRENMKIMLLNNLDINLNHYLLTVPLHLADKNYKTFGDIFANCMTKSDEVNKTIGSVFELITEELKMADWPEEIFPYYRLNDDFIVELSTVTPVTITSQMD